MIKTTQFKNKIFEFYKKNKRDFAWRNTTDPYKILVSEIMLQQTQTSRVIEKYSNFLNAFPTIKDLAIAQQSEVLQLWQGLGYNRRALYLKRTAEIITSDYNQIFPTDLITLMSLPGIGKNTAGAISAFAFNKPVIFIETNIRRVFIHEFFKLQTAVDDKQILPLIQQTLDLTNPRDWYYALMDYGAYLATTTINPNRKSKHYTKQSKFEGSQRQVRGKILKLLLVSELKPDLLEGNFEDKVKYTKALEQLISEGFVEIETNLIRLKP